MESAGDVLRRYFETHNIEGGEKYVSFFSNWRKIVGTDLAAHSSVVDIRNGAAVVEIDHPGWMQLFQLNETAILKRIRRWHPDLAVKSIQMRLVDNLRVRAGGPDARGAHRRNPTERSDTNAGREDTETAGAAPTPPPATENESLSRIPDGTLRKSLERLRDHLNRRS